MTNEKARDFFSAYYEGSLEPGLCVSFEQKLAEDGSLGAEYRSFTGAMKELDTLKLDEIQVPADLHDRICARLDRYLYDQKQKAPRWGLCIRNLAYAGVGVLAIVGGLFAFNSRSGTPQAGVIPVPAPDVVTYTVTEEGVGVRTGSRLSSLLQNDRPHAALFEVKASGDQGVRYVAMQGKRASSVNSGDGTLKEFVKAVADYFRMPVSLKVENADERVTWTFTSRDAVAEVGKVLPAPRFQVSLMQDDMLQIEN